MENLDFSLIRDSVTFLENVLSSFHSSTAQFWYLCKITNLTDLNLLCSSDTGWKNHNDYVMIPKYDLKNSLRRVYLPTISLKQFHKNEINPVKLYDDSKYFSPWSETESFTYSKWLNVKDEALSLTSSNLYNTNNEVDSAFGGASFMDEATEKNDYESESYAATKYTPNGQYNYVPPSTVTLSGACPNACYDCQKSTSHCNEATEIPFNNFSLPGNSTPKSETEQSFFSWMSNLNDNVTFNQNASTSSFSKDNNSKVDYSWHVSSWSQNFASNASDADSAFYSFSEKSKPLNEIQNQLENHATAGSQRFGQKEFYDNISLNALYDTKPSKLTYTNYQQEDASTNSKQTKMDYKQSTYSGNGSSHSTNLEYTNLMNVKKPNKRVCKFCRKNGKSTTVYNSHVLRDDTGLIICPFLRDYVCCICGATGENAHTPKYCPQNNFDLINKLL